MPVFCQHLNPRFFQSVGKINHTAHIVAPHIHDLEHRREEKNHSHRQMENVQSRNDEQKSAIRGFCFMPRCTHTVKRNVRIPQSRPAEPLRNGETHRKRKCDEQVVEQFFSVFVIIGFLRSLNEITADENENGTEEKRFRERVTIKKMLRCTEAE